MKMLPPLPARETPLPGESLASLLRRTAEAMGYEHVGRIRQSLADAGAVRQDILDFSARVLAT